MEEIGWRWFTSSVAGPEKFDSCRREGGVRMGSPQPRQKCVKYSKKRSYAWTYVWRVKRQAGRSAFCETNLSNVASRSAKVQQN
jgi:hypothetical protein